MSGSDERMDQTERLFADIADVFATGNIERIPSKVLVADLANIEGRPWADWRNAKPITANQLAALLRPHGIRPATIRFGSATDKGYRLVDFADAFARYIPSHRNKTAKSTR
jgi:Protein of unknown function (DUF3631)